MRKHSRIALLAGGLLSLVLSGVLVFGRFTAASTKADTTGLPAMSTEELARHDGSQPDQPIYLAMDGLVYDVSAGRQYYETGGDYHYLAGTDASEDLKFFGGEIIRRKYPVIATLAGGQ